MKELDGAYKRILSESQREESERRVREKRVSPWCLRRESLRPRCALRPSCIAMVLPRKGVRAGAMPVSGGVLWSTPATAPCLGATGVPTPSL